MNTDNMMKAAAWIAITSAKRADRKAALGRVFSPYSHRERLTDNVLGLLSAGNVALVQADVASKLPALEGFIVQAGLHLLADVPPPAVAALLEMLTPAPVKDPRVADIIRARDEMRSGSDAELKRKIHEHYVAGEAARRIEMMKAFQPHRTEPRTARP